MNEQTPPDSNNVSTSLASGDRPVSELPEPSQSSELQQTAVADPAFDHAASEEVLPATQDETEDMDAEDDSDPTTTEHRTRRRKRPVKTDAEELRLQGRRALCKGIADIAPNMSKQVKHRVLSRYLQSVRGLEDEDLTQVIRKDAAKLADRTRVLNILRTPDPDFNRGELKVMILMLLLQEESYSCEENRFDEKVIEFEKDLVRRSRTLDFTEMKKQDPDQWHHYDMYRIVLDAAWSNDDMISPDEARLLGVLRSKPGSTAGFLGQRYEPLCTECVASVDHPPDKQWFPQIVRGEPRLTALDESAGAVIDALQRRRSLLEQLDGQLRQAESHALRGHVARQQMAFDLITSAEVRSAFDLAREPDRLRERYGRTLFGSSALLARRLVERGTRFITVSWDNFSNRYKVSNEAWDTHENNFHILRTTHLPGLDQTYSALMEDLDARGLLDETLIVMMGEMGRTPRLNDKGGRDHWTSCYSVLLAGAGIRGGSIYGTSDSQAAYIKDRPVHIRDIVATIYHCLGIDPETLVHDQAGRPVPVAHGGQPLSDILV